MKILCLFVRHGTSAYPSALANLDDWYQRHGLLPSRTLWIIDNALPTDAPITQPNPGVILCPGDNQAWEFSAWARALGEFCEDLPHYDVVHLVTSAFNTLYTRYLDHFAPSMLALLQERSFCLGHIDSYDRPVLLDGKQSASWIRTCFFFLPARLAGRVRWVRHRREDLVFASPDSTQFRDDAPLTVDHQLRIRAWLEGENVGGHVWHSAIVPASGEVARFQKKTLAIINEHCLSITLRQQGVSLVDFCWLFSMGPKMGENLSEIPSESDQLKVRRRVLGIPEPTG